MIGQTPSLVVSGADPFYSYVISLMHFDGTNGSTTITDAKSVAWTARGGAAITTGQYKYGGASLLLDGTGDYVDTPDSSIWFMDMSNYCIEMWFRANTIATDVYLCGQSTAGAATQVNVIGITGTTKKLLAHYYEGGVQQARCDGVTALSTRSIDKCSADTHSAQPPSREY